MTGDTCHTSPVKAVALPTGVTFGLHAHRHADQVRLGQLRAHLHLPTLGDPEQLAGAGADDLSRLHRAGQHQPGGGRTDVEAVVAGTDFGETAPPPRARRALRRSRVA